MLLLANLPNDMLRQNLLYSYLAIEKSLSETLSLKSLKTLKGLSVGLVSQRLAFNEDLLNPLWKLYP